MSGVAWTRDEDLKVIEAYERKTPIEVMVADFGRTSQSIFSRMNRLKTDLTIPYAMRKRVMALKLPKGGAKAKAESAQRIEEGRTS